MLSMLVILKIMRTFWAKIILRHLIYGGYPNGTLIFWKYLCDKGTLSQRGWAPEPGLVS